MGRVLRFLSVAFQPMITARGPGPGAAVTSVSSRVGAAISTTTQTCGGSPARGASWPRPTPPRASRVKPCTPSAATAATTGAGAGWAASPSALLGALARAAGVLTRSAVCWTAGREPPVSGRAAGVPADGAGAGARGGNDAIAGPGPWFAETIGPG